MWSHRQKCIILRATIMTHVTAATAADNIAHIHHPFNASFFQLTWLACCSPFFFSTYSGRDSLRITSAWFYSLAAVAVSQETPLKALRMKHESLMLITRGQLAFLTTKKSAFVADVSRQYILRECFNYGRVRISWHIPTANRLQFNL